MSEYQARVTDRAGNLVAIIPAQISYGRSLQGDGSCTLTVPLDHPSVADPTVLQTWAREILLLRRENPTTETPTPPWQVAHDGPITGLEYDLVGGTITITAGTVKAWLTKRKGGQFFYVPTADLGTIADLLITRAQDRKLTPTSPADPNADLYVAHTPVTTGVMRLFDTTGQGARSYAEILDEFASGSPGFDYDIQTFVDTNLIRSRVFSVFYPMRGQAISTPLLLGSTLRTLTATVDGGSAATHVTVFGYGAGPAQSTAIATDPTAAALFGRLEEVDTRTEVSNQTRLNDLAAEALRVRRPPVRVLSGSYRVSDGTPWRFATIGDTVPIRGSRGPIVLNDTRRIVSEQITVNEGSEEVALTFNDAVAA